MAVICDVILEVVAIAMARAEPSLRLGLAVQWLGRSLALPVAPGRALARTEPRPPGCAWLCNGSGGASPSRLRTAVCNGSGGASPSR